MNETNPYTILKSFKECAGLSHFFRECQIQCSPTGEWYIKGRQEDGGFTGNISPTRYNCYQIELLIKFVEATPPMVAPILPILEALEQASDGVLKLVVGGDSEFNLFYIVYLPEGYNHYHLDQLSKEVVNLQMNCEKLDQVIEAAGNNLMRGSSSEPDSNPGITANIWDSIAELGKENPRQEPQPGPEELSATNAWEEDEILELPDMEDISIDEILEDLDTEEDDPNNESNS